MGGVLPRLRRILFCLAAGFLAAVPPRLAWAQNARQRLAALQERARIDSNDAVVHYELGVEYFRQKKWDEAEQSWRLASALAPQYAEPMLGLAVLPEHRYDNHWGQLLRQRGQAYIDSLFHESDRLAERAFVNDPMADLSLLGEFKRPDAYVENGRLIITINSWWIKDAVQGINDLRIGNNIEAYQRLEGILCDSRVRKDRTDVPGFLLWHHGLAAARTGHIGQAGYDFAVLTGRGFAREKNNEDGTWLPNNTNAFRYLMSLMNFMGGNLPEAIAGFQRTLALDVGLYQSDVQLARIYETVGHWDDAIREREQAITVNPDDPTLLIDLGSTLMKARRFDRAQEVLSQAVEQAPRDPRAPLSLSLVAMQRGDTVTARSALTRFLAIAPSSFSQQITDARERLARITPDH